jgi:hypothetical protein
MSLFFASLFCNNFPFIMMPNSFLRSHPLLQCITSCKVSNYVQQKVNLFSFALAIVEATEALICNTTRSFLRWLLSYSKATERWPMDWPHPQHSYIPLQSSSHSLHTKVGSDNHMTSLTNEKHFGLTDKGGWRDIQQQAESEKPWAPISPPNHDFFS